MVASPRRSRGWRVHALTALITTSVLGMAGAPPVCGAQTSSRVFRVAFLGNGTATLSKPSEDALRAGLRDLGYIEGANLVIASRYADGSFEQLPRLSRELVDMKPDVLVSAGPQALRALRQTTSTLPIVSAAVSDPVEEGLVASLARPGGNITGMAFQNLDLTAKCLELLKETVPDARKIAVLSDATLGRTGGDRQAEAAAERLGVTIQILEVRGRGELDEAFRKAREARAQGLVVLASPMLNAHRHTIIAHAARARLPATYEFSVFVRDGGLMSYGPSIEDMYRRSALYVDKILKGPSQATSPWSRRRASSSP